MSQIKLLTPAEETELRHSLAITPEHRDTLLIEYMLAIGIRANEALKLEKSHFNHELKAVWVIASKGSVSRLMPLPHKLFERLTAYAATITGDKLFPITYDRLKQIWLYCSPKSCRGASKATSKGVHSLRHTFAVNTYKKCRNIRTVQIALGHKSISNTLIYMTYVDNVAELRQAMGI